MGMTRRDKFYVAVAITCAAIVGYAIPLHNLSRSRTFPLSSQPPSQLEETLYTSDCRFNGLGTQSYGLPKDAVPDSLAVVAGDFDGDGDLDTRVAYFRAKEKGLGTVERDIVMFTCYNTTPQQGTLPAEKERQF